MAHLQGRATRDSFSSSMLLFALSFIAYQQIAVPVITWSCNKFRELIAVKVLHTSLLNTAVVTFKVLSLGSYAPMPGPRMHCVSCNTFNTVSLSGIESRSDTAGPGFNGVRFTVVFFCPSLQKGLVVGDVISTGSTECLSMKLALLLHVIGDCFLA